MTSKYALDREDLTLNARLVRGLREAILSGDLKGGARLVEREMTEMFGVSRGLLREAIQTLASEGLITLVPHKGPVVTLLGREEAAQLYRVRGALGLTQAQSFRCRLSRYGDHGLRLWRVRQVLIPEITPHFAHDLLQHFAFVTLFPGATQGLIDDLGNFLGVIVRFHAKGLAGSGKTIRVNFRSDILFEAVFHCCLLYTSDAADE